MYLVTSKAPVGFSLKVISLIMLLWWAGCGSDGQTNSSTSQKENAAPAQEHASEEEDLTQQALYHLQSYYRALENEELQADRHFAPQLQKFFSSENITRDQAAQSVQRGFQKVDNRIISIEPRTLKVSQQGNQFVTTFSGTSRFTDSETGEEKSSVFQNKVTFNQDWKIIRYEDATQKGRSIPSAKASLDQEALYKVATRTLKAFKTGELASIKDLIHPEQGVFLITKPGAIPAAYRVNEVTSMAKYAPWLATGVKELDLSPLTRKVPEFSCTDLFEQEGCFLELMDEPYRELSELMNTLSRLDLKEQTPPEQEATQRSEKYIKAQLVDTDAFMGFYFAWIEGNWFLMVVDLATFDCSA